MDDSGRELDAPVLLYGTALLLSSFLIFWVEPLFTKSVLPMLGGSPRVWNTALVFFQVTLLAGYVYAHWTSRLLSARRQSLLQVALVAVAAVGLPVLAPEGWSPPADALPIPWLLSLFAVGIGLPFFALSSMAPMLQRWFARLPHRHSDDPYFLYAASNLGSLLALLAFPLVLEPWLPLGAQNVAWGWSYVALALLVAAAALYLWRRAPEAGPSPGSSGPHGGAAADGDAVESGPMPRNGPVSWTDRLTWIVLSFAPASLLHGVTSHITTDVAAVPLLWVVPLALYLLTFVLVFSRRSPISHRWMLRIEPWVVVPLALFFGVMGTAYGPWALVVHLAAFFVLAMVCHGELARRRPEASHLTEFYLWMSAGGALGGIFNAVVAPYLFEWGVEYPLMIAAAASLRPVLRGSDLVSWRDLAWPAGLAAAVLLPAQLFGIRYFELPVPLTWLIVLGLPVVVFGFRHRPVRFGLGVGVLLVVAFTALSQSPDTMARERSFYGVLTVESEDEGRVHRLRHGTTLHGVQIVEPPDLRTLPVGYYNRGGPVGQVFRVTNDPSTPAVDDIGVMGLGTGALTCYARPGERWTYYEIDPLVVRWARDTSYFHYLSECGRNVDVEVEIGDGRLSLRDRPDDSLDLLILDAFSSDAVPVHLLTREALDLYLDKLSDHGILLFNTSNRYVNIPPVLARLAENAGVAARAQYHAPGLNTPHRDHIYTSEWVLMTPDRRWLSWLEGRAWRPLQPEEGVGLWTDHYSNVLRILDW